jgi:hypothetical protein
MYTLLRYRLTSQKVDYYSRVLSDSLVLKELVRPVEIHDASQCWNDHHEVLSDFLGIQELMRSTEI